MPLHVRLGEGCSHISAILFKVECAVRLGYTSCISQLCQSNEAYCKIVSVYNVHLCDSISLVNMINFFVID